MGKMLPAIRRFFRNFAVRRAAATIIRVVLYSVAVAGAGVAGLFLLVTSGAFGPLPDEAALKLIEHPLASEVYSADSVLLGRYFVEERSYLRPEDVPVSLKHALVATEDVRFFEHNGIDTRSLLRVLVKTILLQKESAGGGSTLTQQLAKNLYPRRDYGALSLPVNKIREIIIARRLERAYSKDELLVLYLNTIPFADNTFGVKTAADRFFSSPVQSLTWDQSAVLVGMLKATHSYNPRLFPERSVARRNVVLAQCAKYGFITETEKRELQARPLGLRYNPATHHAGLAPYFRENIRGQLIEWCREHTRPDGKPYDLLRDGLKIYTTIDSRMQRYAEAAVVAQMSQLQKRFAGQVSGKLLDRIALEHVRKLRQYRDLRSEGLSDDEIIRRFSKPIRTRIFTWEGEKDVEISLIDSVRHHIQFLQAGLLAMDPQSGAIRAYVGGINHNYFQFDHARESTKRQVGSTFKPIVYAAALENGVRPCDYISARKTVYTNMDDWAPENTNNESYDKKYSMKGGLVESVNTVSVKLIEKAGIHSTINVARKLGITSDLPAVPSIALGTPSVSLHEMVAAYGALANGGMYRKPFYISSIVNAGGKVLYSARPAPADRAISAATSRMLIEMLKGVVSEGTGAALRNRFGIAADIAGKTGTTQSNVDGWFISAGARLVVGAWVGADDPRLHFNSTALGQGAATALPVVGRFYQSAFTDAALRPLVSARFPALPEELARQLDCAVSKSNVSFFEKIFGKKKKAKATRFRGRKKKRSDL